MKHLILDRRERLPLRRRALWGGVTGAGWALWAYLWWPLLGPGRAAALARSAAHLLGEARAHGGLLVGAVGLLLGWSGLQRWEARRRGAGSSAVSARQLAFSIRLSERELSGWQEARRVVVRHDEDAGWIRSVETLEGAAATRSAAGGEAPPA